LAHAQANPPSRRRLPVQLQLGACLEPEREAILRAVRVELGDDPADDDDASAIAVRVECAADGPDTGVILEVRRPSGARRYHYALDWRAQPPDARPRLVGLAVAEAVDASQIELIAVPEPQPALARSPPVLPASREIAEWTVALVGQERMFSANGGLDLTGIGLTPARRLSSHLSVAADVVVEGATLLTQSGTIGARSVSSAPRIVYRTGGRLYGELGLGARVGAVRMRGESLSGSPLVGASQLRLWLGPAASAGVGVELSTRLTLSAHVELGFVAAGATARDLGAPVAVVGGAWTSLGLAAAIAL
jgi:hypothetical protein